MRKETEMKESSAILAIYKALEKKSKKNPEGFEFFHLWDADAQGDMCVRIFKRLSGIRAMWAEASYPFSNKNIINEFKLITED
jgi:hypothetical protein